MTVIVIMMTPLRVPAGKTLDLILISIQRTISDAPFDHIQQSRKPGSGVTINKVGEDGNLVMIAGFFDGSNEIRLMRRDGTTVRRWPARFFEHFEDASHLHYKPASNNLIDLHGTVINPDGSVVFNYEYGGLVKLSKCGDVLWTLAEPTHHSVEPAESGGHWVLSRAYHEKPGLDAFPPLSRIYPSATFEEDLIYRVSEDGDILERASLPEILFRSGLDPLMTDYDIRDLYWHHEPLELVHSNKVGELPGHMAEAFPMFEAGDLVVSLRFKNMIAVIDPDTWTVKWHQTGPWRRQHDPEFTPDGTITLFNNNTYHGLRRIRGETGAYRSNIIKVDPATGNSEVVYGDRPGEFLYSTIRSKQDPTEGGGVIITEFEGGRALEVDASGDIVWEYINRYDEDHVLEITEARLYSEDDFTVEDWSCPAS